MAAQNGPVPSTYWAFHGYSIVWNRFLLHLYIDKRLYVLHLPYELCLSCWDVSNKIVQSRSQWVRVRNMWFENFIKT